MMTSRVLVTSVALAAAMLSGAQAARAAGEHIMCDSPEMLNILGPMRPNQHCRYVRRPPQADANFVPDGWMQQTGGACQAYSGIYEGKRVYWRICLE
jgi:hypothetical protein